MNAHVLMTRTSASSALVVISMPCCKTLPSMISASTRFLAQPRLIMPIFALMFLETPASTLLDRDVGVVLGYELAIFPDLNGVTIEHSHGDMLTVKFHRPIGWRNPAFESRFPLLVVHYDFDVGFL